MIRTRKYGNDIYEYIFPKKVTDDDYEFLLEKLEENFQSKNKFCLLLNLKELEDVPFKMLKKLANYLNEKELHVESYLDKTAIVLTKDFTRKLLQIFSQYYCCFI